MFFRDALDSRRLGGGSESPREVGYSVRDADFCRRSGDDGELGLGEVSRSGIDCIVGSDGTCSSTGE